MSGQKYGLVAVNDEQSICSVCGKVDLRKVMWVVELDADENVNGEAFAVGTTCGSNLLKQKQSKINTAIKSFDSRLRNLKGKARQNHQLAQQVEKMRNEWLKTLNESRQRGEYHLSYSDDPNREEIFRLQDIINSDVDAMQFVVAL